MVNHFDTDTVVSDYTPSRAVVTLPQAMSAGVDDDTNVDTPVLAEAESHYITHYRASLRARENP